MPILRAHRSMHQPHISSSYRNDFHLSLIPLAICYGYIKTVKRFHKVSGSSQVGAKGTQKYAPMPFQKSPSSCSLEK
jgi:hypothetical protein